VLAHAEGTQRIFISMMRLPLPAALPRWYALCCKLIAGVLVSLVQAHACLGPPRRSGSASLLGVIYALPAMVAAGTMLGALGFLFAVRIRQLENVAGMMNFYLL
jgi:ABC-2 type transport system permease protein